MTVGQSRALYATIWRWHFYAGLLVIPFILLLAVTGAAYLFKPQVERWEERAFHHLPTTGAVAPQAQVEAALAAFPDARFTAYRLPERTGDAAMIRLTMPEGGAGLDVFVAPRGEVLGSIAPDARLMELVKRIHGQLLLGQQGSWLVELAASWAIVLVLSGLYLWWPRGRRFAGVLWPRRGKGGRMQWRDLHAVTGFWISGLVLVLLVTGLPWAGVWGGAFKAARTEMGWVKGAQDWTIGGETMMAGSHAGHDPAMPPSVASAAGIDAIVAKARQENPAFPVIVTPPGAPGRFGAPGATTWTVRSDVQNRPQRMSISYDIATGREIAREEFADGHVVDRVVGYGIAWHEGQLFGWINQLIGVLTAAGLCLIAVSGFILWRRRKPANNIGAPLPATVPARMGGVVVIIVALALLLPLLALSLVALWLFERMVLPNLPRLSRWLGVRGETAEI